MRTDQEEKEEIEFEQNIGSSDTDDVGAALKRKAAEGADSGGCFLKRKTHV